MYVLLIGRCFSNCLPLPDWLQPWAVGGFVAIFIATVAWAMFIRRRR